jgi:glycerol kinase
MRGFARRWALDRQFNPSMDPAVRKRKLKGWADAVRRTLST